MARDKMFDPSYQKAFTEAIHKENQIRRQWNLQYSSGSKKSEAVNWDEDPLDDDDDTKLISEREDDYIPREPLPWEMKPKDERAWPASVAPPTRTIPRVEQPPVVMKPVEKKVKNLLYQGLSHDGEGRSQYLKRRWQDSPEQRYYFPICSSWEYGWTYGMDPLRVFKCPRHSSRNI